MVSETDRYRIKLLLENDMEKSHGMTNGEIGERLRQALQLQNRRSIRSFQKELAGKAPRTGIKGTSYASVHDYVSGKVVPRPDWLSAAARILGVRLQWLSAGTGAMTHMDSVEGVDQTLEHLNQEAAKLRVLVSEALEPLELARHPIGQVLFRYFWERHDLVGYIWAVADDHEDVDHETLKALRSQIRDDVQASFSVALSLKDRDYRQYLAAVLSQLSVLYLRDGT